MREIKFRRPILKDGKFYRYEYWGVNQNGALFVSPPSAREYGDDEQFTGLKDKNGKEIYEGDIFHVGEKNNKYEVKWNDIGLKGKQVGNNSFIGVQHYHKLIEVIGNRHKNPELLTINNMEKIDKRIEKFDNYKFRKTTVVKSNNVWHTILSIDFLNRKIETDDSELLDVLEIQEIKN